MGADAHTGGPEARLMRPRKPADLRDVTCGCKGRGEGGGALAGGPGKARHAGNAGRIVFVAGSAIRRSTRGSVLGCDGLGESRRLFGGGVTPQQTAAGRQSCFLETTRCTIAVHPEPNSTERSGDNGACKE